MGKLKYRIIAVLILCTITGLVLVTPASSVAPSWVGDGKNATYLGGFNIELGTFNTTGYIRATALAQFNWTMSGTTVTQVTVGGGWKILVDLYLGNTSLPAFNWNSTGSETIALANSLITSGGYDLFGLEQNGNPTNLWVENPSALAPANVSIGGRTCVISSPVIISLPAPLNESGVEVLKYYDTGTGMLMALNLVMNITALMGGGGGLGGLGSLSLFTFPIVVTSTNVVPFAWNMGGDIILWLMSVGILAGVSALFGVIIYARKR